MRPTRALAVLFFLLCPPCFAAGERSLQIESAYGTCYVDLVPAEGPISMACDVKEPRCAAILLSIRPAGDKVIVTLTMESLEHEISPIGRYEVALPGDQERPPVSVPELEAFKSGAWHLTVVPAPPRQMAHCCGCPAMIAGRAGEQESRVMVHCCPRLGKCQACGMCGICSGASYD